MAEQACQGTVTQLMQWQPSGYVFFAACTCGWTATHDDDAENVLAICRHVEGQ